MKKVILDPATGCWLWQGYRNKHGYGCTTYQGIHWKTHRLFYHLTKGIKDLNLCILHSCDTPQCVNPEHLREGTPADNANDRRIRRRFRQRYLVPQATIDAMCEEFAITQNMNAVARKFNKSTGYTWNVVNRKLKRQVSVG